MDASRIDRDLQRLEADLRRLEAEYNMYFAGRMARPPWETRSRVEALVRQCDRARIQNYGDRYRFSTLQARFATFIRLWDRALRDREEGRPGPLAVTRDAQTRQPQSKDDRVLCAVSFQDPLREIDKLTKLYESLVQARQENGEEPIPFEKFAALVTDRVKTFQQTGSPEVGFRVAIRDGRVDFTARALRGAEE